MNGMLRIISVTTQEQVQMPLKHSLGIAEELHCAYESSWATLEILRWIP